MTIFLMFLTGCGAGAPGEARVPALESLPATIPNDSVILTGSLLASGLKALLNGFTVDAKDKNSGESLGRGVTDAQGSYAMVVPRGRAVEVTVQDSTRQLFVADAGTADAQLTILRVDPNVRTTAIALIQGVRPDLAHAAERADVQTLKPLLRGDLAGSGIEGGKGCCRPILCRAFDAICDGAGCHRVGAVTAWSRSRFAGVVLRRGSRGAWAGRPGATG
jgi:hypothetical protein